MRTSLMQSVWLLGRRSHHVNVVYAGIMPRKVGCSNTSLLKCNSLMRFCIQLVVTLVAG